MNTRWQAALLIARREFLEHVRTRGFWLSLGTVPLILLLSLAIPVASELSRPDLSFAVTDRSGWLLNKIVRDADASDLERILGRAEREGENDALAALRRHWRVEHPAALAARVDALLTGPADDVERAFLDWYRRLDPPAARRIDPGLWRARFQLVHAADLYVPPYEAEANLSAGRIFAWIEIPEDPVGRPAAAPDPIHYVAANLTNRDLREWFETGADRAIRGQRRREIDLSEARFAWLTNALRLDVRTLDAGGAARAASAGDVLMQWGPVAFVYILWISIQVVTQMLLSSTVEEKSGKLVEVLLSATDPLAIMAGKIIGTASVGGVIVITWLTTFVGAALGLPALLGIPAALELGGLAANPVYLISFIVYYLLGFLLYAALLSGLGALCTTVREAQTLAIPVQSALFLPLLAMVPIARDPSGTLAAVLTWVPPFTPFVMMNRAAQPPAPEVYIGTTLLMLFSVALAFRLGARLFRIGILSSGQAPGFASVLRMLAARTLSATAPTSVAPAPQPRKQSPGQRARAHGEHDHQTDSDQGLDENA